MRSPSKLQWDTDSTVEDLLDSATSCQIFAVLGSSSPDWLTCLATPPKLPSEPITTLPAVRGFSSP